ncbi:sugar phosphate nucleotidyltransferase [Paenibacillus hamazuiensis]|uniref:sugar phosphate nucleotidyltransferase n=1 Tax=Paenibacillus hamazuiensis TaxID=2936508 RepID=UPI00200BCBB9|nr:sugar phosphate nucleotidyltransferase [Paenibacillus hamazuiensis]
MKGVILAGGLGTRLQPMTRFLNKHLLPVGPNPMIHYALSKLAESGIDDILLVCGKKSAGLFIDYIGSGREWDVRVSFTVQEEAGGIAHALALAEGFVQPDEKFIVLLGDNLFEDSLADEFARFRQRPEKAHVFLKEVDDPRRFGVPVLDGTRIVRIEEKPEQPQSSYCVTGIYMYDADVFDVIRSIRPSARGELEITDVNNAYAASGMLSYSILRGWWLDAGTHHSLWEASRRMAKGEME